MSKEFTDKRIIKDIKDIIIQAIQVDRRLPKVGPTFPKGTLARQIVIDDYERSASDVLEDLKTKGSVTGQEADMWYMVMGVWLPILTRIERRVVLKRLGGMGFKRLCQEEHMSRTTAWRIFNKAILSIRDKIYCKK